MYARRDDRLKRLEKWLKGQKFKVVSTSKKLLEFVEQIQQPPGVYDVCHSYRDVNHSHRNNPIVRNFYHESPMINIHAFSNAKLHVTFSKLQANFGVLDGICQAMSLSHLLELGQEASCRLFYGWEGCREQDVAMIISDLDLRNDRKQRLNKWLRKANLLSPFANCSALLEWLNHPFSHDVAEYHVASCYLRKADSPTGPNQSQFAGNFFCATPTELGITFAEMKENILLFDQLSRLCPLDENTAESKEAKLRLFKNLKDYRLCLPADIVSDLDLTNNRVSRLDAWLADTKLKHISNAAEAMAFFDSVLCPAQHYYPPQATNISACERGRHQVVENFFKKTVTRSPEIEMKTPFSMLQKILICFDDILHLCPLSALQSQAKRRLYQAFVSNDASSYRTQLSILGPGGKLDPAALVVNLDLKCNRVERLDIWLKHANLSSFKSSSEVRVMQICCLFFSLVICFRFESALSVRIWYVSHCLQHLHLTALLYTRLFSGLRRLMKPPGIMPSNSIRARVDIAQTQSWDNFSTMLLTNF